MAGALSGLKIVELGEMVSAPYAAKLMADMGAEVIKIERPGAGDRARGRGPFPGGTAHLEKSGLFLYLNTNKLGVTLDVSRPEGFELLERLAAEADVLIHNVAPSDMDRIGLSFERLRGPQSAPGDDFDFAVGTERPQARVARRGFDAVERKRHLLHQRRRPRASRDAAAQGLRPAIRLSGRSACGGGDDGRGVCASARRRGAARRRLDLRIAGGADGARSSSSGRI